MALTRKFLSALAIEEEKAEQIISAHVETVDSLKADRDKYKAEAEKLPDVQKELDELKKKQGDNGEAKIAEAQKKYADLEKEFNDFKADIKAKESKAKKESAKKAILKEIGVSDKFIDLIMKASSDDVEGFEFEEDGKTVKDADKKKEAYKTSYADFIEKKGSEGANPATPPASNGGVNPTTRAAELFKKHSAEMYGNKKED